MDTEPLEAHGLRVITKSASGALGFEGELTPELAAKMARLQDILTVFSVMGETPVKLTLTVPADVLQGVVDALNQDPDAKRRARHILYEGHVFVPEKPSKFWVGHGAWHESEDKLKVRKNDDFPESVTVTCYSDPQIIFPPAERWVRQSRYSVLRGG